MVKISSKLTRGNNLLSGQHLSDWLNQNPHALDAFFFAERGCPVYPVDGKHSIHDATADVSTVIKMWKPKSEAKCALALGAQFGLIAIEADEAFTNLEIGLRE